VSHVGRETAERADGARVIALPPLLYGVAFVLGLGLNALRPAPIFAANVGVIIGAPVLVLGGFLARWGNRVMRHAGTSTDPRRATTYLVVSGPFRFSRNPLYVARTLLYVGLALIMDTFWPLATLIPMLVIVQRGVIRREERYLERKFGTAYEEYRARVRRWV